MPNIRSQIKQELQRKSLNVPATPIVSSFIEVHSEASPFSQPSVSELEHTTSKAINPTADGEILQRSECPATLQSVLPLSDQYMYVVESLKEVEPIVHDDTPQFDTFCRINLTSKAEADKWLAEFMEHSKCTYRVTKTTKPCMKRVLVKYTMHCQHFRKPLSQKQKRARLSLKSKSSKRPLTAGLRDKKTDCPSRLTLTIQVPSKNQGQLAERPYLLSHKAVLNLKFCHNHSVHSAHTLSFRPLSEATKEKIFTLFTKGHSAASARHAYETELMLQCADDGQEVQKVLADRAVNPTVQDYSRLYDKWRESELGRDNGPGLFESLQSEVDKYNSTNARVGGKAKLQVFESHCDTELSDECVDSDEGSIQPPPPKKRKVTTQPMILALCTPLMVRAHENVPQAGEMVFCDATSSLDRFNTSVFIISTGTPSSGVPLGVIIASDEQQATIHKGMQMLAEILPKKAFFGKGAHKGPTLVMTDDSSAERGAIQSFWQDAILLLCSFHFLQRRWTWLHDGKNHVPKDDRVTLIHKVKELVYANSEDELSVKYQQLLKSPDATHHPNFVLHIQGLWDRRREWALCYRKAFLVRGNHTNNYAEAGMRILKELVFSRVKAYNVVQMFHFLTETMERYYQSKLLSVAHTRVDRYISVRFQGLNAKLYTKENIKKLSTGQFSVPSKTDRGVTYHVDMDIGVCTCPQGRDGSPCSHQAAVVIHYGSPSVNCIPTMDPKGKRKLAFIAFGENAIEDLSFYKTLKQPNPQISSEEQQGEDNDPRPDFSASCWDLIRDGAKDDKAPTQHQNAELTRKLSNQLDSICDDIKLRIDTDELFRCSIQKFATNYERLSTTSSSNAYLTSAFHRFGWCFGGTVTRMQGGILRRGRRIPIQAKSAGRRRKAIKRGKAVAPQGRAPKAAAKEQLPRDSRYFLPIRARNNSVKRLHSLQFNISKGQQNGGKW